MCFSCFLHCYAYNKCKISSLLITHENCTGIMIKGIMMATYSNGHIVNTANCVHNGHLNFDHNDQLVHGSHP